MDAGLWILLCLAIFGIARVHYERREEMLDRRARQLALRDYV